MQLYKNIPQELQQFISDKVLPLYDAFDAAHQRDHAETVIRESMKLTKFYEVNPAIVFTTAACHDLGLCEGREHHHTVSARIIRQMPALRQWFSASEIEVIAEAAEDHRASSHHAPRTIYGKIVAEADRLIEIDTILRRIIQYGLAHYPALRKEEHFDRMVAHLNEKYAEGGYLQLWIPESPNAQRLAELRKIIGIPEVLRKYFEQLYTEECQKHAHNRGEL